MDNKGVPRREDENYMTMTMLVNRDFRNKISRFANERNISMTAYIVSTMEKVMELGGDVEGKVVDCSGQIDKLNEKLDTVINLISKL